MNGNVPDDDSIIRKKLVSSYLSAGFLISRSERYRSGFSGILIDFEHIYWNSLLPIKQNYHFV